MTAGLVGQNQITTFTTPVNGTSPIDANQVRGNDNTIKTSYDLHDLDSTIHFQSSLAAARPAAGVAGRKWINSDTLRVYYDNGVSWDEIAYLQSGGGTIAGNVHITGTLLVDGATTIDDTLDVSGLITSTANIRVSTTANASLQFYTSAYGVYVASATGVMRVVSNNVDAITIANSGAGATFSGDVIVGASKFTVSAASGNTAVAGTLAATGAITGSSTATATAFISATASPAASGAVRLARADTIKWNNGVGSTMTVLGVDSSPGSGNIFIGDGTLTGTNGVLFNDKAIFPATATAHAGMNTPHGTAPTSPVDGDIWTTTTGMYVRINGVTVGPLS